MRSELLPQALSLLYAGIMPPTNWQTAPSIKPFTDLLAILLGSAKEAGQFVAELQSGTAP